MTEEDLQELYSKIMDLKIQELFSEPYDPPEDLEMEEV